MLIDQVVHLVLQHWIAVSISIALAYLVRNRYRNGLNKYPGPFLASLTDWWRFYDVYKQRPEVTHRRLHAKYGDVVRLGPNTLSFSNPKALKTIYGLNKGFIKVGLPLLLLFPLSLHLSAREREGEMERESSSYDKKKRFLPLTLTW